jgi:hypothetical protein
MNSLISLNNLIKGGVVNIYMEYLFRESVEYFHSALAGVPLFLEIVQLSKLRLDTVKL